MPRKGENIYKRKDGRWEGRYIKYRYPDGKIKYGYCYDVSYHAVKEKVNEAKLSHKKGNQQKLKKDEVNFSLYCDEWLKLKSEGIKRSTYVKYFENINNHIKPFLGIYNVYELTTSIIIDFRQYLIYNKNLSSKTVRDILTQLNSILKYTSRKVSCMQNIDIVYPVERNKEIRILSRDEQNIFIKYLLNDIDCCKFGILLAFFTGMRIGEICALKWKDISLENKTITISSSLQRIKKIENNVSSEKTEIIIGDPKSNSSYRVIPLTEYMYQLCISQYINNNDAFVLTGTSDKFMEPRVLQYRLKRYTFDCGFEDVHFHTLRHTFATRCVEVGFELKSLSEILGHSNPKVTLERYVHSSIELKRENMKKLSIVGF